MTSPVLHDGAPEDVGMDPARIERLRGLLAGWVACGDTPSVAVCVARRGVVVLHEAFGVLRHGDATPTLRRDSIFPIQSISKPFTAAAVMSLVDDGLIGLNRPFIDYVPDWDRPDVDWLAEATVADLLGHTAGIDDLVVREFILAGDRWSSADPPPVPGRHPVINKVIDLSAGAPLARRPGTAMLYSSIGFMLLGDIVRRVSGQPFWQYVRSRVFEPIGMRDSHFVLPPALRERRVYREPGLPDTLATTPWNRGTDSAEHDELDWGSNAATSTAGDLAVFLQMLLNGGSYGRGQILSRASAAAMTRSQVDTRIPWIIPTVSPTTGKRLDRELSGGGYGYGLFIFGAGDRFRANGSLTSKTAFGHLGSGGSYFWADPEQDVVGVYLSVTPRMHRDFEWRNTDLFQNAVHAAIIA